MLCGARMLIAVVSLGLGAGCSYVSKRELTACQSQNRILAEQTQTQLAELERLKTHCRGVEDRLIAAEQELARVEQQGTQYAKRKSGELR